MSDEGSTRMATFLKNHPRLMGALFTLVVLLSQAAPVVAEGATSGSGGP